MYTRPDRITVQDGRDRRKTVQHAVQIMYNFTEHILISLDAQVIEVR